MFRKIFIGLGIVIAVIIVIASGYYTKVYISTEARINKIYTVTPQSIEISGDSAEILYGGRLVTAKGCTECHGSDLGGKVFADDAALGYLAGRNLTKGKGGLPEYHNTSDWVLALKHGIRRDGKPLLFMPSHEFTLLSEGDMAAIIAYTQQLPKVDRSFGENKVGPLGRILTDLDKLPLIPAEKIDHSRTLVKEIKPEVSIAYGKYLSIACQGCHRENMKGGDPVAPGYPVVANITSSGHPGKWTEDQFMTTLRTGLTPEGKALNTNEMPWNMTSAYTDTELKALFVYLKSI